MAARVCLASLALFSIAVTSAYTQETTDSLNVTNRSHERMPRNAQDDVLTKLEAAKSDALVLYSDYASRAGRELKFFLKNMTGFADNVIRRVKNQHNDTSNCWVKFEYQIRKIEHDTRRAATYSGDSHHKFLLGHMIVFRIHLNKSEDYLMKCVKELRECGQTCEFSPRVRRWRHLAMDEIHRVREDIQHSKKAYRDLVSHARRKLIHFLRNALRKKHETIEQLHRCESLGQL